MGSWWDSVRRASRRIRPRWTLWCGHCRGDDDTYGLMAIAASRTPGCSADAPCVTLVPIVRNKLTSTTAGACCFSRRSTVSRPRGDTRGRPTAPYAPLRDARPGLVGIAARLDVRDRAGPGRGP